jgi:radical SAM protein with 4Fe4S-binding SPASM domain
VAKEMTEQEYLHVLDQYDQLLSDLNKKCHDVDIKGMVTVTGGEPLAFPLFYDITKEIRNRGHRYGVLTNGTLINDKVIQHFLENPPAYVQVSIDGTKEIHDDIRGAGNFDRAINGLKMLVANKIPCCMSFTAHKQNYKCFYDVAKVGAEIGVNYIWSDRLIPTGQGSEMEPMNEAEFKEFMNLMMTAKIELNGRIYVKMRRALQFLVSAEPIYRCQAGRTLIVVMPDGTVYPCRRMPINLGNVKEKSLSDIYFHDETNRQLRDDAISVPEKCGECHFKKQCGGGLKCLSYALTGKFNVKDKDCWR